MQSFAVSRINIIQCVRRPYRKGLQTHLAWRKWAQQPRPLSNSADHKTAQSPSSSSLRLQWWAGAEEETTVKILVGFLSMQYNWIFKCNASMLIKHATASRAVAGMVLQFQSSTRVNFTIKGAHWKITEQAQVKQTNYSCYKVCNRIQTSLQAGIVADGLSSALVL